MIIGITGHRLGKYLGGYTFPNKVTDKVTKLLRRTFNELSESILEPNLTIITGMAIGTDMIAAQLAVDMELPFIAAVPFIGQEKVWPEEHQKQYKSLLKKAKEVKIVSEGGFAGWKLQKRNEWIVDNCDVLVAVWHHTQPASGTYNCLKYARSIKKDTVIIET